jgi:hypothetical protein
MAKSDDKQYVMRKRPGGLIAVHKQVIRWRKARRKLAKESKAAEPKPEPKELLAKSLFSDED